MNIQVLASLDSTVVQHNVTIHDTQPWPSEIRNSKFLGEG